MKLADGLERHPLIREAFESGFISKEQVRLILRIADRKNEKVWIDYAAHVPTATLQEEVERCRRIKEYDCLAAGYYAILPSFRYITDDRFRELPEEMQDIIRTGSWYQRSSPEHSWPIEENSDEQMLMEYDPSINDPSIKFFLPEVLFDLWNTVFAIWLRRSVAEEVESLTVDYTHVEMAEGFLAALLQG